MALLSRALRTRAEYVYFTRSEINVDVLRITLLELQMRHDILRQVFQLLHLVEHRIQHKMLRASFD